MKFKTTKDNSKMSYNLNIHIYKELFSSKSHQRDCTNLVIQDKHKKIKRSKIQTKDQNRESEPRTYIITKLNLDK